MKKKFIAASLVLAIALSGTALASGDSLITRSYLTGAYRSSLASQIQETVKTASQPIYTAAVARTEQLFSGTAGKWRTSVSFTQQSGERGDTVTLALGAGLFWTSGSAKVTSGQLVDASTGTEVSPGGALTASHRYLAAEQTVVSLTSSTAWWLVEGDWMFISNGGAGKELPFTDVLSGAWYHDAVKYVAEKGLFEGVSDTRFAPFMFMDRGMLATVLYRLAGSPSVQYTDLFHDIPAGSWYSNGAIWAGQTGVILGNEGGMFYPQQNASREQIAVMLYRYASYTGCDISASVSLNSFSDCASVHSWAYDAMSWAVAVGIIEGDSGTIKPMDNATRAEVAVMLQRFAVWAQI